MAMIDSPEYLELWEATKQRFQRFNYVMDYRHYELLTAFVMTSYLQDNVLEYAPYLQLVGAYNTGKTTCLEVLKNLVYHPYYFVLPTSATMFRTLDVLYPATALIDEAASYDKDYKAAMLELLNAGNRYPAIVPRMKDDGKGGYSLVEFKSGSMKVFAGYFYFIQALGSRCIKITMRRPPNTKFRRQTRDDIPNACLPVQQVIEKYFQQHRSRIKLYVSEDLFSGNDRVYDIFRALLTSAPNSKVEDVLIALGKEMQSEERDIEGESFEAAVAREALSIAKERLTRDPKWSKLISSSEIADHLLPDFPKANSNKVGWAARKLGLEKQRDGNKNYIKYDHEKLAMFNGFSGDSPKIGLPEIPEIPEIYSGGIPHEIPENQARIPGTKSPESAILRTQDYGFPIYTELEVSGQKYVRCQKHKELLLFTGKDSSNPSLLSEAELHGQAFHKFDSVATVGTSTTDPILDPEAGGQTT